MGLSGPSSLSLVLLGFPAVTGFFAGLKLQLSPSCLSSLFLSSFPSSPSWAAGGHGLEGEWGKLKGRAWMWEGWAILWGLRKTRGSLELGVMQQMWDGL